MSELPDQLIDWRLQNLETGMGKLQETVDRLEKALIAYKAVMKFAMALASAIGAGAALAVNFLVK